MSRPRPPLSPLTVEAERRHAGGTVEDGVAAGQRLSVSRVGLGTRHRPPVSAVVPAEEWTPAFQRQNSRTWKRQTPAHRRLLASTQAWSLSSSSGSYSSSSLLFMIRCFCLRPVELPANKTLVLVTVETIPTMCEDVIRGRHAPTWLVLFL